MERSTLRKRRVDWISEKPAYDDEECATCRRERKSRQLVAVDEKDERFQSEEFRMAPAIFSNNDVKFETNKLRGVEFARRNDLPVTYSIARDTPSLEALRERPKCFRSG